MGDALDVLNVTRKKNTVEKQKVKKKTKVRKQKRPNGLNREAYSLLEDSKTFLSEEKVPLTIEKTTDEEMLGMSDRKDNICEKVKYEYKEFKQRCRNDNLKLKHWIKCIEDNEGNKRYPEEEVKEEKNRPYYLREIERLSPLKYSEKEWIDLLEPICEGWTQKEINYLIEICHDYDLRFPVIADRYAYINGPMRSLDDIKEKYYSIFYTLSKARKNTWDKPNVRSILKRPYNSEYENKRRLALDTVMSTDYISQNKDFNIVEKARKIEENKMVKINNTSMKSNIVDNNNKLEKENTNDNFNDNTIDNDNDKNIFTSIISKDFETIPKLDPGAYSRSDMIKRLSENIYKYLIKDKKNVKYESELDEISNKYDINNLELNFSNKRNSKVWLEFHANVILLSNLKSKV